MLMSQKVTGTNYFISFYRKSIWTRRAKKHSNMLF